MSSKSDLARALHHAADLLVGRGHDTECVEAALELVQAANELLASGEELTQEHRLLVFASQMIGRLGAEVPLEGQRFDAFSLSPFSGLENPLSPTKIDYFRVAEQIHAEVIVGAAYEGATGRAHGGLTAAVFDDLMGALQRVVNHYGFTRTLEISYLGPVPVDSPVSFVARLASVEEKTFTVTSEASANGEIVATATGVFTAVDFAALLAGD